jgi:hypothetical protein
MHPGLTQGVWGYGFPKYSNFLLPERNFYQSCKVFAFKSSRFCNELYNFLQPYPPSFEATWGGWWYGHASNDPVCSVMFEM